MATELAPLFSLLRKKYQGKEGFDAFQSDVRGLLRNQRVLCRGRRFNSDHRDYCFYIQRSKNANVVVYQAHYKLTPSEKKTNQHTDYEFDATEALHPLWIKLEAEHVVRRRNRGEMEDTCELNVVERKLGYGCHSTALSFKAFFEIFFAEVTFPSSPNSSVGSKNGSAKVVKVKKISPEQEEEARYWWEGLQPHKITFAGLGSRVMLLLLLPPLHSDCEVGSPTVGSWFSERDPVPVLLMQMEEKVCAMEHVFIESVEPKHFYQLPKVVYIDMFGLPVGEEEPAGEIQLVHERITP